TSEDLLFTLTVIADRDLSALANRNSQLIESARAPDAQTVTVTWRGPYIDADKTFSFQGNASLAVPLPSHILQSAYESNKEGFFDLPYWSSEFVGMGPYRLDRWERGSQLTLHAFDRYPLGRPRIDEINVKFIPDQ